jgi:alkanesulfonate monooxygenase SsuD/methylene tetrahydromethanopterin reductase-like flavin-dependent oxidoreductase (luciferase family)
VPSSRRDSTFDSIPEMHIGVNLNNREALIAPDYGVPELLDLAARAEALGLDSVWVGDSLLSKPRYEPLALLAALSQRTTSVRLGTACLVTTLRNPVQLAQAWATLDVLSGGRMILGACSGNIVEEGVKEEFAVVGIEPRDRMAVFEEGLRILRSLLETGRVTHHGTHFQLDDAAFSTGMEPEPLLPVQSSPPLWIVANPSIGAAATRGHSRAARRVAELGDGWMTCCRASHPEEVSAFVDELHTVRDDADRAALPFAVAYQVTIALGATTDDALAEQQAYIDAYYPGFSDAVQLADWGPAGTAEEVVAWIGEFHEAGVDTFICRFASLDQRGQLERFARDVLSAVRTADTA